MTDQVEEKVACQNQVKLGFKTNIQSVHIDSMGSSFLT